MPLSESMRAVLRSLRDHPHDDTTAQVASHARLAIAETESLLDTLAEEHLVLHADRHWQLSRRGWSVAREVPERPAPT